jgi:nitrous oxidase accessory protein NosD
MKRLILSLAAMVLVPRFAAAAVIDVSPGSSIQSAVNAGADGDTIRIAPGTYQESVLIVGKSLTLIGAPGAVIQAPVGMAQSAVVLVFGADVTLQDLVIDGANARSPKDFGFGFQGVFYINAGGSVSGCEVKNVVGPSGKLTEVFDGFGLLVANFDRAPRTLWIVGNNVHDFNGGGIMMPEDFGAGLTVHIRDNTVTGAGRTDVTGQQGIVAGGATGDILRNRITGLLTTNPFESGIGIFSAVSTDVTIDGNILTDVQLGIIPIAVTDLSVVNNTIRRSLSADPNDPDFVGSNGMLLINCTRSRVVNNVVAGAGVDLGLFIIGGAETRATANDFSAFTIGILVVGGTDDLTLTANRFEACQYNFLFDQTVTDASFHGNRTIDRLLGKATSP